MACRLVGGWRQAIIWTNGGILIGAQGINFNEILIKIHTFPLKKIHLKMSVKWRPFCLGLNVLMHHDHYSVLCLESRQHLWVTKLGAKEVNWWMKIHQKCVPFIGNCGTCTSPPKLILKPSQALKISFVFQHPFLKFSNHFKILNRAWQIGR